MKKCEHRRMRMLQATSRCCVKCSMRCAHQQGHVNQVHFVESAGSAQNIWVALSSSARDPSPTGSNTRSDAHVKKDMTTRFTSWNQMLAVSRTSWRHPDHQREPNTTRQQGSLRGITCWRCLPKKSRKNFESIHSKMLFFI